MGLKQWFKLQINIPLRRFLPTARRICCSSLDQKLTRPSNYVKKDVMQIMIVLQEAERRQQLLSRAYDKFAVRLTNVQLIFADNYRNGITARTNSESPFHLLRPTGMDIAFHKSSIDDLQLPKYGFKFKFLCVLSYGRMCK